MSPTDLLGAQALRIRELTEVVYESPTESTRSDLIES